jgi:hypothetical protein
MKVASASLPNNCYYCHCVFDGDRTLDHIVAKKLGGNNSFHNLLHCCRDCNTLKGHLTLEQFMKLVLRMPWKVNKKSKIVYKIHQLILYRNKNIKNMIVKHDTISTTPRQSRM